MPHNKMCDMTLGVIIKTALVRKGKTQAWLASKLGLSSMSVYRICNDLVKPRQDVLLGMAENLDLPSEFLIKTCIQTQYKTSEGFDLSRTKKVLEQLALEDPTLSADKKEALFKAAMVLSEID